MLVELDKLHQKEDDVVLISMANLPRKHVFCCFAFPEDFAELFLTVLCPFLI